MSKVSTLSLAGALALATAFAACQDMPAEPDLAADAAATHAAHTPPAGLPGPAAAGHDLATLRRATARYHDVDAALDDGFLAPPPEACVAAPPGGMGYHYVNPARMDLVIDPALPEAVLYEPMHNGKLRLVAVEFLVHGDSWDAVNADPPSIAGQVFDPPPDRTAVDPPGPFYTLHVWLWKNNPSGLFAPFNPRVSCP
jgi:hypothetical protein